MDHASRVVNVLIVVDALNAVASGKLADNVYLVDSNKYMGSWQQGKCELHTLCHDGYILSWRVEPIDPAAAVEIVKFEGELVENKICQPVRTGIDPDYYWQGRIESRGETGKYRYTVVLSINGKQLKFEPYVEVVSPEENL